MDSTRILEKLIAFPTVNRDSNLDLIGFVAGLLDAHGVACRIIHSEDGHKANLFATIGPADASGIMLSGHTDVVLVDGQTWTLPPFDMTKRDGKLYGRGAADMKGFVACALAACLKAAKMTLRTPLHLALSYDEEIGCIGVGRAQWSEPPHASIATTVDGSFSKNATTSLRRSFFAQRRLLSCVHTSSWKMCFDVSMPMRIICSTGGLPLLEICNDLILAHRKPCRSRPPQSWEGQTTDPEEKQGPAKHVKYPCSGKLESA